MMPARGALDILGGEGRTGESSVGQETVVFSSQVQVLHYSGKCDALPSLCVHYSPDLSSLLTPGLFSKVIEHFFPVGDAEFLLSLSLQREAISSARSNACNLFMHLQDEKECVVRFFSVERLVMTVSKDVSEWLIIREWCAVSVEGLNSSYCFRVLTFL